MIRRRNLVGILCFVALSQSKRTSLLRKSTSQGVEQNGIQVVTMDDIGAMMRAKEYDDRTLYIEDDTCWHGGQENQTLFWLVSHCSSVWRALSRHLDFTGFRFLSHVLL